MIALKGLYSKAVYLCEVVSETAATVWVKYPRNPEAVEMPREVFEARLIRR